MFVKNFIVATAGHVDHGKSALVKTLTGTDPDRLPEEKARGITIDLGFAHLELAAPSTINHQPSTIFHLGIVDVPGHEDFVKNMVAGVGSIDLALFVVAADDGWMPQTEEHLQILTYLGVTRAVVALTKIDLAEDEAASIANLREQLQESPFAGAPIVPTSIVSGRGFEDLKAAMAMVLAETPPPSDIGKPRLPVDRVFVLRGVGTIVTGTLTGGTFTRGQAVVIQPTSRTARVRSLQNHGRDVESSPPGARTAINLPDIDATSKGHKSRGTEGVSRGDVITLAELGAPSKSLDVVMEKSARLIDKKGPSARPLKDRTRVRVHHGTGNFPATVQFAGGTQPLTPGGRLLARLRFETPVFALAGDHFIVRDWSEQSTLAGGVILDADADGQRFNSQLRERFLQTRAQAPGEAKSFVASQLARDGVAQRSAFLVKSRFSAAEISGVISQLQIERQAVVVGEWVADAAWWQNIRQRAVDAIDTKHRERPELPGLPLNELRSLMESDVREAGVFEALISELCRNDFRQVGVVIQRAAHRPALPPHLQAAGAKLRAALAAKPFEPPSRKELAPDAIAQQALRFLVETGEAVEVNQEIAISAEAFTRATDAIKKFLSTHGPATVSELRQMLGTNRRVIVPVLERLDRDGITLRQGDKRILGRRA